MNSPPRSSSANELLSTRSTKLYREYNGEESGYGEDENRVAPEPRGFQLRNIAGGWKLYARDDFAPGWTLRDPLQSATLQTSPPTRRSL